MGPTVFSEVERRRGSWNLTSKVKFQFHEVSSQVKGFYLHCRLSPEAEAE